MENIRLSLLSIQEKILEQIRTLPQGADNDPNVGINIATISKNVELIRKLLDIFELNKVKRNIRLYPLQRHIFESYLKYFNDEQKTLAITDIRNSFKAFLSSRKVLEERYTLISELSPELYSPLQYKLFPDTITLSNNTPISYDLTEYFVSIQEIALTFNVSAKENSYNGLPRQNIQIDPPRDHLDQQTRECFNLIFLSCISYKGAEQVSVQ